MKDLCLVGDVPISAQPPPGSRGALKEPFLGMPTVTFSNLLSSEESRRELDMQTCVFLQAFRCGTLEFHGFHGSPCPVLVALGYQPPSGPSCVSSVSLGVSVD